MYESRFIETALVYELWDRFGIHSFWYSFNDAAQWMHSFRTHAKSNVQNDKDFWIERDELGM